MHLILDLGNTNAKLFLFNKDEIVEYKLEKELEVHELADFLSKHKKISAAILSSVINHNLDLENELKKLSTCVILDQNTKTPLKNLYKSPNTLGKDRLAAAVGANELFPNQNVLAIDAGTCIKYEFINDKNEYLGGAISPGIAMRFKALHQFTDKLPLLDKPQLPVDLIGTNTNSSIYSGVINAAINEIKETINQYEESYPNLNVILSGGDSVYLEKGFKNSIFAEPFLVQKGLNRILTYNL